MIDIKDIREAPERYRAGAKAKRIEVNIDRLLAVDKELLACRQRLQDIATEKNAVGKSIAKLPPEERQAAIARLSVLKEEEGRLNEQAKVRAGVRARCFRCPSRRRRTPCSETIRRAWRCWGDPAVRFRVEGYLDSRRRWIIDVEQR